MKEILNYIIGAVMVLVIMSIAYSGLKPHKFYKRRLVSSLFLKASYLLYLFGILNTVYFSFIFRKELSDLFSDIEMIIFIVILIIPTIGILIRRSKIFVRKRDTFNYLFTNINLFSLLIVLLMVFAF